MDKWAESELGIKLNGTKICKRPNLRESGEESAIKYITKLPNHTMIY